MRFNRQFIIWILAGGSAVLLVLTPAEWRTSVLQFLWNDPVARVLVEIALIAAVASLFVRWRVMSQLKRTVGWLQAQRLGTAVGAPLVVGRFFKPLFQEVFHLVTSLETARATAEEEAGCATRPNRAGPPSGSARTCETDSTAGRSSSCPTASRIMHVHKGGAIEVLRAGQRPRHRARAGHARLRRHVGRARRGDADRETVDARDRVPRAARRPAIHAAPRLAHAGRGGGLLLRLRQRGPVAALPHRAHAPAVPRRRTGSSYRAVEPRSSPTRCSRRSTAAERRSCSSRTITSRSCRA